MLPVNANLARYKNDPNRQNCPLCSTVVEDEKHFLFVCPLYAIARIKYNLMSTGPNPDVHFMALMSNEDKNVITSTSFFLLHALKMRSRFIESEV